MNHKMIYLDNAATTAVRQEVLDAMLPYFSQYFGNPSSIHKAGRDAKIAIENARKQVAAAIGATSQEIYFTGCGSESNNWAIRGLADVVKGKHIITSAIEHHAILHTCEYMEKKGYRVTYLPVDEYGRINPQDVKDAIGDDTILITIMMANNEIGTIQPIAEISEIAKTAGIPFHTDAVQAVGAIPVDVKVLNVDMLSLSAHKFNGPKGVGALYIRKGLRISPFIFGGAQEHKMRAGTENIASIVGLGKAIEITASEIDEHATHLVKLRNKLIDGVMKTIPDVRLNGHPTDRLPNNINMCFRYIEGESLLMRLDLVGIEGSSGSACTSGSLDPSHVLLAIGLPHEIAHGSLRLTLGIDSTQEDMDFVLEELPKIVQTLREMSPLYQMCNVKENA